MVAHDCYLFRMKRLAKRLLSILLTIIVVSLIVFLLQEYALGDSASYILSEDAGGSAADIFRASVSADGSLMERYISFLQAFLSGRWGNTVSGQDIAGTIADRAGATLSLAVFSVLLSVLISVPVSLVSVKPGKFPDRAASFLSVIILSLPSFLTSFFLIILFSFLLGILPPAGYVHPSVSVPGWIRTLMLPALSLSLLYAAMIIRIFRKALRENIDKPYARALYAAGASYPEVLMKGALKPSLPVLYTLIASSFSSAVAGAAVTETVFAFPGLGSLMVTAALSRDAVLSGTLVMLAALAVSSTYMILELVLFMADPRSRREA